jgi:hypothetical protein
MIPCSPRRRLNVLSGATFKNPVGSSHMVVSFTWREFSGINLQPKSADADNTILEGDKR